MSDNTQVNIGTGDLVRDIDRSLNPTPISAKTQVVQLDAGGQSEESLVNGKNPLPVFDRYGAIQSLLIAKQILMQQAGTNGFAPVEVPLFLVG